MEWRIWQILHRTIYVSVYQYIQYDCLASTTLICCWMACMEMTDVSDKIYDIYKLLAMGTRKWEVYTFHTQYDMILKQWSIRILIRLPLGLCQFLCHPGVCWTGCWSIFLSVSNSLTFSSFLHFLYIRSRVSTDFVWYMYNKYICFRVLVVTWLHIISTTYSLLNYARQLDRHEVQRLFNWKKKHICWISVESVMNIGINSSFLYDTSLISLSIYIYIYIYI